MAEVPTYQREIQFQPMIRQVMTGANLRTRTPANEDYSELNLTGIRTSCS